LARQRFAGPFLYARGHVMAKYGAMASLALADAVIE
jgi:hypothetical protein